MTTILVIGSELVECDRRPYLHFLDIVSLLGDEEDIKNRKKVVNIAFNKQERIWLSRRHVSIQRRVKM